MALISKLVLAVSSLGGVGSAIGIPMFVNSSGDSNSKGSLGESSAESGGAQDISHNQHNQVVENFADCQESDDDVEDDSSQKCSFESLYKKLEAVLKQENESAEFSTIKDQLTSILQVASGQQESFTIVSQDLESCKNSTDQEKGFCYLELKNNDKQYKLKIENKNDDSTKNGTVTAVKQEDNNTTTYYKENNGTSTSVQFSNLTTFKDSEKRENGDKLN